MSAATCACCFSPILGMKCFVTAALRAAALQPHIKETKPANTLIFFCSGEKVPQAWTRKLTSTAAFQHVNGLGVFCSVMGHA